MKSEYEIVKEVTELINLPNKTDGSLVRYKGIEGIRCKKPDGIYEIDNLVIILDAKAEGKKFSGQIKDYMRGEKIINPQKNIIGIQYNGIETHIYINTENDMLDDSYIGDYRYYLSKFEKNYIDQFKIYTLTKNINNILNDLGLEVLLDRMIWTASFLVVLAHNHNISVSVHNYRDEIVHHLHNLLQDDFPDNVKYNAKLGIVEEEFKSININDDEIKFNLLFNEIRELSQELNSSKWRGEDVMGIFFNEFTRYQKKSNNGQVFTPEIWTSFMYKLIDCNYKSKVLDAACGSGGFLTKAMSLMIEEMPSEATKIKRDNLYGVEWSRRIFAVACANMMLHKDGKSNIIQGDSQGAEVAEWIRKKNPDKVLMNPPFEKQKGINIVYNVLHAMKPGKLCAFILPDRTLYTKNQTVVKKILKENRLLKIIKMPEQVWAGMAGVTTSIFVFQTGLPHNDSDITKFWIKNDGMKTVKNSGRHDINRIWEDVLEPAWLNIVKEKTYNENLKMSEDEYYNLASTVQVDKILEYELPEEEFTINEEDFDDTVLERVLFEEEGLKKLISELSKRELIQWMLKK